MNQRTGKKGRRSDRNSTPRSAKVPVRNELSYLLPQRAEGVYCNPPLAHTLATLIGCVVEVQMKNGEVYEGVLRAISPNMEISLNVAHIKGEPPTRENVYDRKEVKFADVITISAKTGSNPQLALFKTDTEISGRTNGPHSRELQPFTDFSEDQTDMTLGNSTDSGWSVDDMWAVNQNKFKVSSTFDEELPQYTTPLSRDGEGYKQRELEAIQKASEIESKTKTMFSRHGVDDVGTEEDRWSAVVREPAVSNVAARPQCSSSGPGLGVKENGSHVLTPSALSSSSATTQAPAPTSTSPLLAPATSTTMSSPAVPPLPSHSESSSTTLTTPPSQPPPGNNQSSISNDVITDSSAATEDKTNDGVNPAIKLSNGAEKLQQTSVGESATSEKECDISVGETQTAMEESALQLSRGEAEKGQGEAEEVGKVKEEVGKGQEEEVGKGDSEGGKGDGEGGKGDGEGVATPPTGGQVTEREQNIKNFKLDPTAKEFVIPPSFIPSSSSSSSSSSPSASSSSVAMASPSPSSIHGSPSSTHHTYHHTNTHSHTPRGNSRYTNAGRSPRPRQHTPTNVYTHPSVYPNPESMLQTAVSSGYILTQQPATLFRPNVLQQGFSQYGVHSPMMGGMITQGVLPSPQILASPHAQMLAAAAAASSGGQQQFATMGTIAQQHQFIAQPTQQIITPQGVISPASHAMYVHSAIQQQQQQQQLAASAAAAAVAGGVPQVSSLGVGQQIVGTSVASGLPRVVSYQMPGAGK